MTTTTPQPTPLVHCILQELGLPLLMLPESTWALTHPTDDTGRMADCRMTLGAGGDLIVEIADDANSVARYVFDAEGRLVSLHHSRHFHGPLFKAVRKLVLRTLHRRCHLADMRGRQKWTSA